MTRPRLTALFLLTAAACLSDRVIAPPGPLPAVIGINKPTVQFVRFALGRSVAADTVRVTNNGEQALGAVSAGPGIEYVSGRAGWLTATVVAQGNDTSALILTPVYADSAGTPPDTARVTLHAAGAQAARVVTVIARTIPGARFEFSANPVTFASVPGGPPSVDQAFSVRNGGNGELPIYPPRLSYVSAARNWLVVSMVPGTDPRSPSFTITAKTGGLASGLHIAYVVFESPAGDATRAPADSFIVQTRIGEPRLGVSSGVVSFSGIRGGAEVPAQTITLSNAGEGTLESLGELSLGAIGYKAGEPTGWLAATLVGNTVSLTATTGTLPASTLTAQLPVTSENGGTAILNITFEVRLPGLTLSSRTLSFNAVEGGASPAARSVTISNSGSGSLATLGALSIGGISFPSGQAAGWLTATLVDSVVTIGPTLGALGPGTYAATVAVTSENGGGDAVAVTFTVARANDPPVLTLSAKALTLSGTRGDPNPPQQTVAVSNTGGGSLGTVSIGLIQTSGGPWLTATLSGSNVIVGAITGQLSPGSYQGSVGVASQNGGTAVIAVTFTVGVPVMTLSALTASFGATEGAASPAPSTVTISNSGSGTINSLGNLTVGSITYGAGQPSGWLTATRAGTVITLTAATGALNAGLYTATVPVSSVNGGASAISVTFSIVQQVAQPVLALSSTSLSFSAPLGGPNPPNQSVSFFNSGGGVNSDLGAITAVVPGAAPWLTRVIGPTSVAFSVAVGSLTPGVRTATVPVASANGGTVSVVVTFTIADPATPAALALSRTAASFAATQSATNPPNQTIAVTNAGGGSLGTVAVGAVSYTGTSTGWLTRTLAAAAGVITLSAATNTLPAGVSTATFTVSTTPAVTGSPVTVTVALTVAAVPVPSQLSLSSTTVSFAATEGAASPAAQTVTASNTGSGGLAALGTLARGAIAYTPAGTWLTTATIAAATGVITVQPTTDSLPAGIYRATFPVTASTAASGSPRSVSVTVTVAPAAGGGAPDTMTVSSHAVSFAAIEGGASPAQKTVTISNPGPGALAALGTLSVDTVIYTGSPTGWLTTASVAAATGVVALRPTTGSLTTGTYDALVRLAGSAAGIGSPQTVAVSFTVSKAPLAPSLSLSAQSASFSGAAGGTSPAAQTIDVVNLGGGSLGAVTVGAISYSGASTGWLAAAFAAATSRVTLTPTTTGLPAGSSTATFAVASPAAGVTGSPRTVTVYLTVTPPATPPALTLSAEAASFAGSVGGAAPANQVITVSNTGGGSLGTVSLGTIAYTGGSPGWLTPALAGANLTLSAVIGGRAAGTYTATFPVSSAAAGVTGSPVTVTARLSVAANAAPPVLTLATQAVSFAVQAGANPAPQTVAVINTGGGTLASLGAIGIGTISYTGTSNGWLVASVSGGIITLTPTAAALPSGSSTASFQVTSANGGASAMAVTLTVAAANAAPSLALSLSTVTFDAIAGATPPAPQVVTVSNAGGGTLGAVTIGTETFVPSQPSGWLASPTSGAAVTGSITFAVASSGLAAGIYTAAVPVTTANAGVKNIAVTLRVQAPILTLSTRAVSFSATQGTSDPAAQAVTVSNTGIGTLASLGPISLGVIRYGRAEPVGWLAGSVAGSTVNLTARLAGLPSGSFTALVPVVSAFGGTDTVTATFTVAPGAAPPVLSLSSELVSFSATVAGANPTPQAVTFSNSGGQTLGAVTLGAANPDAPWLDVALAGNQITFTVDVSGLAAGSYATEVAVETANAGSETIAVALTVGAPRIALSTRSVTFGDTVGSTRALTSDVFISNSGAGDLASLGTLRIGTVSYAGSTTGWLQSPTSNTTLPNPIVALRASVGALAAGTYTATIPVTSERGGSETITLTMAVNRPDPAFDRPSIEFFQNGVAIDSAVAPKALGDTAQFAVRVKIGNPNNTAIALSGLRVGAPGYVRGASGWITGAFLDKTSAPFGSPAELLVAINAAGLPAGRHRAEIEIRSDVAKNSPRKLSVVLVVQ